MLPDGVEKFPKRNKDVVHGGEELPGLRNLGEGWARGAGCSHLERALEHIQCDQVLADGFSKSLEGEREANGSQDGGLVLP